MAEPLFSHRMVAVASPRSDWGRRRAIDAATLARDRVILYGPDNASRRLIDEWFERAGVSPRIPMEGTPETAKRLVAAGLGVSVVPAESVREEVKGRRLVARPLEPPLSIPMGSVRRRDKPRGPAMDALLSALAGLRHAR